jgi:hypothetical protein
VIVPLPIALCGAAEPGGQFAELGGVLDRSQHLEVAIVGRAAREDFVHATNFVSSRVLTRRA